MVATGGSGGFDALGLDALEVVPAGPVSGTVEAPSSKSVTNRLLVIAGLAAGTTKLSRVLVSDDTAVMWAGLAALGARIREVSPDRTRLEIEGTDGVITPGDGVISAGLSGTTLRFLASVALLARGTVTLDGKPPLRRRPILPLLGTLAALGASIESDHGHPPIRISSPGIRGGRVEVDAALSSQFVTGLLLVAPYADANVELSVRNLGASGYVDLTVETMRRFGAVVDPIDGLYVVEAGRHYHARAETVEYDASAAAHLFALAMATGGTVTVANATDTRQPDAGILAVFEQMGGTVGRSAAGAITVSRPGDLHGTRVDISAMPDQLPTLAVLGALASGRTTLDNVSVARGHETDRVAAIANELSKLGGHVAIEGNSLTVEGGHGLSGCPVDTYDDHRMAMALASLAAVVGGMTILEPGCVAKTYPGFWADAERLGLRLRPASPPQER
jgi:3-phosphoshikimate 1-carboxyvinyltransferase